MDAGDLGRKSFDPYQREKLVMTHYSLTSTLGQLFPNCNFMSGHFKTGAENVFIIFDAEMAGSICAAKRVNSEEGRVRGCGLGDSSRVR